MGVFSDKQQCKPFVGHFSCRLVVTLVLKATQKRYFLRKMPAFLNVKVKVYTIYATFKTILSAKSAAQD